MKKRITLIVLALVCLLILASCGCKHQWIDPNCTDPATCSQCGETEGSPIGHSWNAASCSAPRTCEICGETQGEALAHTWTEATCETPKTCQVCGTAEGEALGHSWLDATYEAPKTCEICGATEGEPLVADFTTSSAYSTVRQIIDSNMGSMNPQYEYNPDSKILYIYLTAPSGTAYALATDPEGTRASWNTLKTSLAELSGSASNLFSTGGFDDVSCCIMLLNDANTENVLLGVLDGEVVYDFMEE